jgi:EAL domain-containing protein (putative c-di-GMP-specific phosphodiesterase class I)
MFLPLIDDHQLIVELGEWVIGSALAQMHSWHDAGLDIPISVNIDAVQLQQADFVDRLRVLLAAHPRLKPFSLELEVLETSTLDDVDQTASVLRSCREIGVSFALDDFGTGYSSLTYLKRLPADVLKIDRSFVCEMLDDPESLTILEGVLGLASAFRRQVIAEGVETLDHGLMLLQLGCEIAQGYGIARPMPASELPPWVIAWNPDPRWANVIPLNAAGRELLFVGVEHRAWIEAFEAHLRGKHATPPEMDSHRCRFGAWLDAEQKAGRDSSPAFQSIKTVHRKVHALAAAILASQARDRKQKGLARLAELHALSNHLLERLESLRTAPEAAKIEWSQPWKWLNIRRFSRKTPRKN